MDAHNTFETKTTAHLARLEWAGLLVVCVALTLWHWDEVDWALFVALFLVIDLIGYIPGAIAYRRSPTGALPRVYYLLYNSMHSLTTWTAVGAVWVLVAGWQWALLTVPIHLLGDRALFGNSLKPFGVSFEPRTHPLFAEFQQRFAAAPQPWAGATDATTSEPEPKPERQVQHARG